VPTGGSAASRGIDVISARPIAPGVPPMLTNTPKDCRPITRPVTMLPSGSASTVSAHRSAAVLARRSPSSGQEYSATGRSMHVSWARAHCSAADRARRSAWSSRCVRSTWVGARSCREAILDHAVTCKARTLRWWPGRLARGEVWLTKRSNVPFPPWIRRRSGRTASTRSRPTVVGNSSMR